MPIEGDIDALQKLALRTESRGELLGAVRERWTVEHMRLAPAHALGKLAAMMIGTQG